MEVNTNGLRENRTQLNKPGIFDVIYSWNMSWKFIIEKSNSEEYVIATENMIV